SRKLIKKNRNRMVVGDSTEVKKQVEELIEHFTADEVLFVPLLPNVAARKKAVQLLADAFIHSRGGVCLINHTDLQRLQRCDQLAETASEKEDEPCGSVRVSADRELLCEYRSLVANCD